MKLAFFLLSLCICHALPMQDKKASKFIVKTENFQSESVNGKNMAEKESAEKVLDSKTGKTIASVEKTELEKDGKKPVVKTKIDVPSEGIHEETKRSADKVTLDPPEEVANYIFETSDINGVKKVLKNLVQTEQLEQTDVDNYMKKVYAYLDKMHQVALEQMKKQLLEERQEESNALENMIGIVQRLNEDNQLKKDLHDYTAALYAQYKTKGDAYARLMLNNFAEALGAGSEEGILAENVKEEVKEILSKAVEQVQNELEYEQVADDKERVEEDEDVSDLEHLSGQ